MPQVSLRRSASAGRASTGRLDRARGLRSAAAATDAQTATIAGIAPVRAVPQRLAQARPLVRLHRSAAHLARQNCDWNAVLGWAVRRSARGLYAAVLLHSERHQVPADAIAQNLFDHATESISADAATATIEGG